MLTMPGSRTREYSGDLKSVADFLRLRHINLANATLDELEQLTQACDPASFGVNEKEVLDETYRKAGKMDTERFALVLDLPQTDLITIIRDYLLEGRESTNSITAKLHKLNVYSMHSIFIRQPQTDPQTRQGIILQIPRRYSARRRDVWVACSCLPNTA